MSTPPKKKFAGLLRLGQALSQEQNIPDHPGTLSEEVNIQKFSEVYDALTKKRPIKRGRPQKLPGKSIDEQRASIIWEMGKSYPGKRNISEWIEFAKAWETKNRKLSNPIFSVERANMKSSVSRGLKALGVQIIERRRVFDKS